MVYQVHLEAFEGPFDLLLHLIDKNEVDIYDIPIAAITAEYLAYLDAMEQCDLEVTSEFLVMAATLLSIKAKMLVPKPVPEEGEEAIEPYDPRAELVQNLLDYRRFKEVAALFGQYEKEQRQHFSRPNETALYASLFQETNPLEGKTLADLEAAFQKVWQKAQKRGFVREIHRSEVSMNDMMARIQAMLADKPQGVCFEDIFMPYQSRTQLVVAFLALLELVRQFAVQIQQSHSFGTIYIFPVATGGQNEANTR
jgi:segregation and condensation protein A